jgi:hypothetical protein
LRCGRARKLTGTCSSPGHAGADLRILSGGARGTAAAQLDTDDLREILVSELGEAHCFRSRPTEKYFPATVSDYYSMWIDNCGGRMFIKLLISNDRLVITSFKKDNRYG